MIQTLVPERASSGSLRKPQGHCGLCPNTSMEDLARPREWAKPSFLFTIPGRTAFPLAQPFLRGHRVRTPSVPSSDRNPALQVLPAGGGCSLAQYQVQRPPTTKARRKTGPADGQDVLGISLELTLPGLMKTHELSFWTGHQLSVAPAVSRGCASDHAQLSLACSLLQVLNPLWFKEGESRKEGMERGSHIS